MGAPFHPLLKPGQMGIPICLYTEAVLHHGITH